MLYIRKEKHIKFVNNLVIRQRSLILIFEPSLRRSDYP